MPAPTARKPDRNGTAKRPTPKTPGANSKTTAATAAPDEPIDKQIEALGDDDDLSALFAELSASRADNGGTLGGNYDDELFDIVAAIVPKTIIEMMLTVQIAELHRLVRFEAARLNLNQPVKSAALRAKILDTLVRAFASHAETFRKLRG